MAYELRPAEQSEEKLFHRLEGEAAERHGAIGYMRADFGRSGREFYSTWFDTQRNLKTQDFKAEFDEIINSLREDGEKPPFSSRGSLQTFCFAEKGLNLADAVDGFKLQTLNYTYAVYCNPFRGDYDVRVFAYDNRWLLPELAGEHELPQYCFTVLPSTGEMIRIQSGESGYHLCNAAGMSPELIRFKVDDENGLRQITKRQEAAILGGSLFGWDTPAAKPWNYDVNGTPRIPHKNKNEPDRG